MLNPLTLFHKSWKQDKYIKLIEEISELSEDSKYIISIPGISMKEVKETVDRLQQFTKARIAVVNKKIKVYEIKNEK